MLELWRNFIRAAKEPRWRIAMAIAALSDAISFGLEFFSLGLAEPIQILVDLATAAALLFGLGFRWPLAVGLVVEAIPGLALFPTWVAVIPAMMATEKAEHGQDPQSL